MSVPTPTRAVTTVAEPLTHEQLAEIRERHAAAKTLPGLLAPLLENWDHGEGFLHDVEVMHAFHEVGEEKNLTFALHSYGDVTDLLAEVERLRAELADLQGQNAMTEQHFSNFAADSIVETEQLRQGAERAEAESQRLHRVIARAFEQLESDNPHEAEQTLREALYVPAVVDEPTPEQVRIRAALRAEGERMTGRCSCSEFGPCPACAPDAAALAGALADDTAHAGGAADVG
ncbi:hypothetical protein GCM10009530_63240 [Microbispora corallina]|uniref:Uncharacterized protein n=1 Tax=Microbispora corallina TaxID=83302 RepID=A0ABQ4GBI8_9ACTN|nr:hypothetical protein [Microbispora corallina]GIH44446.1 hypothetical protein Mco01_74460 [Microbispora corallina]